MMATTKIEWADKVWNPVTGCTKVSEGCRNCYAELMANRFWGDRKFSDVRYNPEKLFQPLSWKKPARVFVNSMSDLFHKDVPFTVILNIWRVMMDAKQHTFMILTKRPERMIEFIKWLNISDDEIQQNIWLGVSVEDQKTAEQRIPDLLATPAKVRFLSCEPLLGPLDLWKFATREETFGSMYDHRGSYGFYPGLPKESVKYHEGIDWVIAGGESGPNARPMHPDWARSIRDQCVDAGVPFFFKQWGEWVPAVFRMEYPTSKSFVFKDGALVMRAGKKKAGRVLDGREWNEFPNFGGMEDKTSEVG